MKTILLTVALVLSMSGVANASASQQGCDSSNGQANGCSGQDGSNGVDGQDGSNGVDGQDAFINQDIILDLENLSNAGTASSFAMSHAISRPDNGYRLGLGQYNNQTSIAFGGREDDITFAVSYDTQGNVGASMGFDF